MGILDFRDWTVLVDNLVDLLEDERRVLEKRELARCSEDRKLQPCGRAPEHRMFALSTPVQNIPFRSSLLRFEVLFLKVEERSVC